MDSSRFTETPGSLRTRQGLKAEEDDNDHQDEEDSSNSEGEWFLGQGIWSLIPSGNRDPWEGSPKPGPLLPGVPSQLLCSHGL